MKTLIILASVLIAASIIYYLPKLIARHTGPARR